MPNSTNDSRDAPAAGPVWENALRTVCRSGGIGRRAGLRSPCLRASRFESGDRHYRCAAIRSGGYVSFVSDLRLAFACPSCRKLVFTVGT